MQHIESPTDILRRILFIKKILITTIFRISLSQLKKNFFSANENIHNISLLKGPELRLLRITNNILPSFASRILISYLLNMFVNLFHVHKQLLLILLVVKERIIVKDRNLTLQINILTSSSYTTTIVTRATNASK